MSAVSAFHARADAREIGEVPPVHQLRVAEVEPRGAHVLSSTVAQPE